MSSPGDWCSPPTPRNLQAEAAPDPRERDLRLSSLCATGWRPLLITGLLRDLLVRHFSDPSTIEDDSLKQLVWRPDERTDILVESIYRWRGELTEKRPALLIKRNQYQNRQLVMNNLAGLTESGHWEFVTAWIGSHTVFCIHGSGAGAEILASEVQRELTQFAPVVVKYLGLLQWAVTEVGEIAEVEEARESFVVPVTVGWAYDENWRIEQESLKLRRIPLSVLLDGANLK